VISAEKLEKVLTYIDLVSEWTGKATSYLVLVLTGTVTYEVVCRYAFNAPTIWAQESSTYLYGAFFMLGGAYVLLHDGHVRVDIFYSRLSQRGKAIVDLITFPVFFFLFVGILVWEGGKMAIWSWSIWEHTQSPWSPPIYPLKTVIPVASLLLFLQGLARYIRDIRFLVNERRKH
jgi:TRAP-type mannitol/chloroaromatic compound transport system permease small subunit